MKIECLRFAYDFDFELPGCSCLVFVFGYFWELLGRLFVVLCLSLNYLLLFVF